MPSSPHALVDLRNTRQAFAAARDSSGKCLAEVSAREATRAELRRTRDRDDPQLEAAEADCKQAEASLRNARDAERVAKEAIQTKLGTWLSGFAPDDLEEVIELSTKFPVVLLPVRLETRFFPVDSPTELRVRIYPDEIAADSHEPALTERERRAGETYWIKGWDPVNEAEAWRALVRQYAPPRAAWIARQMTPSNSSSRPAGAPTFPPDVETRPTSWSRAAEARALPDRWMVLAYRKDQEVHRVLSGPVLDPLALSPDPVEDDPTRLVDISGDGLAMDAEMTWMVDYERAKKVGMAVTIANLTPNDIDQDKGFDRLLVVGVKASIDPTEAGERLAALLRGHRHTRGLAFVPQGTPTNNTADSPSGWPPPDPGGSMSFALERQGLSLAPESDGNRFLTALGLTKRLGDDLPRISGADRTEHVAARAMNRALWPATWGYFLEQLLAPGFDQAALRGVRDYFVDYVHGRGPFPAFRVGDTPYGLLPVSSLADWVPDPAAIGAELRLPAVLTAVRENWLRQKDKVARIGRSADPDADLIDVLAMDASAREVRIRETWGEDFIANLFRFYGTAFFGVSGTWADWAAARDRIALQVRQLLDRAGWAAATPDPRLTWMAYANAAFRFRFPLVTSGFLTEEPPLTDQLGLPGTRNYIEWIRQAPILAPLGTRSLERDSVDTAPLLYLLLRQGMLLEYAHTALDIKIQNGLAMEADRREPELVGIPVGPAGVVHAPVWERFAQPVPSVTGAQLLGDYLVAGRRPETRDTDEYRAHLRLLARLASAELERLMTETLDVCSHRVDAWLTSLAVKRLESMRRSEPDHCHLGAFGWVEDVRSTAGVSARQVEGRTVYVQATSGGYVHAPSPTHAAAAAVLRNGFLTRAAEAKKPFAINLSSARVRSARWLLDAIRQGQPLGAVLGYHFERGLHERKLEKFIPPLRNKYPLVAHKSTKTPPGTPAAESIAARNAVDGLSLLRSSTDPFAGLGPVPSAKELEGLQGEFRAIGNALDAVADLLTAESIYQMVRGNAAVAGASLDAMAQGVRPPDPEIAQVPRGGITLAHRVLVLLGDQPVAAPSGWPSAPTPRAQAEPCLDGWAGILLGDPTAVRCRVSYPDPTSQDPNHRTEVEVQLSELKLRPIDLLALAGEPASAGQASELDRRVAEVALAKVPSRTPAITHGDLRIAYAFDAGRDPATERSFLAILEMARSLAALVGGARPLRPADLLPPEEVGKSRGANLHVKEDAFGRATAAWEALKTARSALAKAIADTQATPPEPAPNLADLLDTLRQAALLGVPGAFPLSHGSAELLGQAASVATELDSRFDAADRWINEASEALDAATTASDPTPHLELALEATIETIKAVFGRGFVFLPRFIPAAETAEELRLALAAGPTLVDNDEWATRKWLQQAAPVRAPLARWRKLAIYATALGTGTGDLDVVQLPYASGARWAALPFASEPPRSGLLSLVLSRPAAPGPRDPWVGLVLDEWSELIPHGTADTAVALHYDDPGAEAAQTLLIAVPPTTGAANWDSATLVHILHETLDLAKMRLVDNELLGDLGQLLPALYLATNPAGDAIGLNLAAMRVGEVQIVP